MIGNLTFLNHHNKIIILFNNDAGQILNSELKKSKQKVTSTIFLYIQFIIIKNFQTITLKNLIPYNLNKLIFLVFIFKH